MRTHDRQSADDPLYASIAAELERLIDAGALLTGHRVPSVRTLSRQRGVSMTTALAALRLLERRGRILARPKSGYFVATRRRRAAEPAASPPPTQPQEVGVSSLLAQLVADSRDPALVPLGAAVPEPHWFPLEPLRRELTRTARRKPELLGDYGDPAGSVLLRRALAHRYAQIGCPVEAAELTVTHGCMEALNLALAVSTRPGDVVAVESPTYFGFLMLLESHGLKALELPTDPRTGLSIEALEAALGSRRGRRLRACLLVPNFSNPLGGTLPDERKRALVELAARHDLTLIEDDIYAELGHDGRRPPPLKAFDRHGCVLLCSSFSKSLAPGARIGWIAAGPRAGAVRDRRYLSSIAVPALTQEALTAMLAGGGYLRHLHRLRSACRSATEEFGDAIAEHFPVGTRISRPQGGFVLWVELPPPADALDLFRRARHQGVAFAPGPLFSASGRFRHCLRLNCARDFTPRTARAIATLGRLARAPV